jgi:hypothetical protein
MSIPSFHKTAVRVTQRGKPLKGQTVSISIKSEHPLGQKTGSDGFAYISHVERGQASISVNGVVQLRKISVPLDKEGSWIEVDLPTAWNSGWTRQS